MLKISQAILNTGMASMIILYGSYARCDWKDSTGIRSGKKSDYDIMVLTINERDRIALQQKAGKLFHDLPTVVQVLVETDGFVNMHLREW